MISLKNILDRRLIVCVGCGGVGKTTTAAALALTAAREGRRVAVITFDPAKRLKDALGLDDLSVDPQPVMIEGGASFDALALDTKRTWDSLVERFAGSREAAERILTNRLYQELSNELAGSAEYMAMEKLHELAHLGTYDLLIVDTPPSSHARDLLHAPNRLLGLLATRAVSLLRSPASLLSGIESTAARTLLAGLLKGLERWSGLELMRDLSDFVGGFEHMIEGFAKRAEEVNRLLRSRRTAFLLVTTAEPYTVETTIGFHRDLSDGGFTVAGIIANRVLTFPPLAGVPESVARWEKGLQKKLLRNYEELRALSARDEAMMRRLSEATGAPLLGSIAAVTEPPTSIAALQKFATQLRST